nr:hypothetical protein [Liquorilactobacillus sucicola]
MKFKVEEPRVNTVADRIPLVGIFKEVKTGVAVLADNVIAVGVVTLSAAGFNFSVIVGVMVKGPFVSGVM